MHTDWDAHVVLLWWECFPRIAALAVCVWSQQLVYLTWHVLAGSLAAGVQWWRAVVESSGREREDT